jgi:hypothetical protein
VKRDAEEHKVRCMNDVYCKTKEKGVINSLHHNDKPVPYDFRATSDTNKTRSSDS